MPMDRDPIIEGVLATLLSDARRCYKSQAEHEAAHGKHTADYYEGLADGYLFAYQKLSKATAPPSPEEPRP